MQHRIMAHDASFPKQKTQSVLTAGRPRKASPLLPTLKLLTLFAAMAIYLSPLSGRAQSASSSGMVGRVTDPSGAVVPQATVHIVDIATNAQRVVTTNDTGDFTAQNLPPSNYSIRVEKAGFKVTAIESVALEVGKIATEPITLQVGSVSETIQVSTDAPQLQTQEATVGQVITQVQVNDLPLNGRDVLQLATLSAGVSAQSASAGQYGARQLYITVDSGRPSSNNYVMDGV